MTEKKDILMTRIGSIGVPHLINDDKEYAYYVTLALIKVKENYIDAKFLNQNLQSNNVQKDLHKRTLHVAYPQKINLSEISLVNFKHPIDTEEQQKIGNFFNKIDRQIELEEKKLDLLKEQKKGYMQKIFSQELWFKDKNDSKYKKWTKRMLTDIADVKTGNKNVEDNIPNGKYAFFDRSVEKKYLNEFDFDEEAIIYPGEGSEFLPKYFNGKYSLHQRAYSIYNINDMSALFLNYYLCTQNKHFLRFAVGSTVKSLRMDTFKKLQVASPVLEEQQKIGDFFQKLDQRIELQSQKIETLKIQKQGFLQKMFV